MLHAVAKEEKYYQLKSTDRISGLFFFSERKAEVPVRARHWSLDNEKSASARVGSTGIRRRGEAAFFAA